MRMFGAKSNRVLEQFMNSQTLKALYEKYARRRRFEGLLHRLLSKGFLKSKLCYGRKIYISCLLGFDELPLAIVEFKKRNDFRSREKQAAVVLKNHFAGALPQQKGIR